LKIKRLRPEVELPMRATSGSACYDVCAAEKVFLSPMQSAAVPTGLAFALPDGVCLEIRPRSGWSSKKLVILNSPGTLDSDYRGELFILVMNLSTDRLIIDKGNRIAQIRPFKTMDLEFEEVDSLGETKRGNRGLGSTGGCKEENMQETVDLDILLEHPTPQDVIGAIFAYSELETFPSDRKALHEFIHLEKAGDGAELLEPFVFSEGDLYPFSRLFESALMQLQLGRWIFTKGPRYDRFILTEANRTDLKERVNKRFSPKQLSVLEKIGKEFRDYVRGCSA
jgi:dUTP pyrophosphatase